MIDLIRYLQSTHRITWSLAFSIWFSLALSLWSLCCCRRAFWTNASWESSAERSSSLSSPDTYGTTAALELIKHFKLKHSPFCSSPSSVLFWLFAAVFYLARFPAISPTCCSLWFWPSQISRGRRCSSSSSCECRAPWAFSSWVRRCCTSKQQSVCSLSLCMDARWDWGSSNRQ